MKRGCYTLYMVYIAVMVTLCFSSSHVSEVMGNCLHVTDNFHASIESGLVPET